MSMEDGSGGDVQQLRAALAAVEARAERAEAEVARLRVEELRVQRFEDLIGYMPVVVWESWFQQDPSRQRIGYVSDYILPLTGYTREEWHTQNLWSELIHPEDRPRVMAEWREHMAAGTGTLEYRWVRRDGQVIWAITRMSVIKDETGKPAGVRGITMDVTEQKLAEAARGEALAREEALRGREAALAELSTPLIPITDRVMVMPLVGSIDGGRAQRALEVLLEGLSRSQASLVILDITGVPQVDASVAAALVRAARAAELLGAGVVLTGIRPDVARLLVELGADLGRVVTKGNLQSGVAYAMARAGAGGAR